MDNDLKMEKRVDVLKKAQSAENTADLVPQLSSHYLQLRELYWGKKQSEIYTATLLGRMTGCSACWLGFEKRNNQILA